MNSEEIKEVAITSCKHMYEQLSAMQKGCDEGSKNKIVAMSVNEVKDVTRKAGYLVITARSPITDIDNLGLYIEGYGYYFDQVWFDNYDEKSLTICVYPDEGLQKIINNAHDGDIKIVSDMKWLVDTTRKCYEEHGGLIRYPREPENPCPSPEFPSGCVPNKQQVDAVKTILGNGLSYIWGAPGTGKTQFVIAACVIRYLKNGGRVAVIAPTNNAVEQALRGILKVLEHDDPEHRYIDPGKDVLRMGSATKEFMTDYPDMCENRSLEKEYSRLESTLNTLRNLLFDRRLDLVKADFDAIGRRYELMSRADAEHRDKMMEEVAVMWDEVCDVLSIRKETCDIATDVDCTDLQYRIDDIKRAVFSVDTHELDIPEYRGRSDDDILEMCRATKARMDELEPRLAGSRTRDARILAMTPFTMMSREYLYEPGGLVSVDHIFVDEVGYSNLIQTLPVLMFGVPVAMLGDHMQLPPVCELEKEHIRTWAERDGYMRYAFMWDASARLAESLLFGSIEDARTDYLEEREPRFMKTKQVDLTSSHRFAQNLAEILDECVYRNGISGTTGDTLKLVCINVVGNTGRSRSNPQEAYAVKNYLGRYKPSDFAILTPYNDQKKVIKDVCRSADSRIFSVHASQGKEWNTVIFSVADNRNSDKDCKLRFTSSIEEYQGLKVVNTAVSRAKSELVIVCDREFWIERAAEGDLLGKLVESCTTVIDGEDLES